MALTQTSPQLSFTQVGEQGPRVLLVMGYGVRGNVWKPQVDELGKHCQVLFFDNRGIGESEAIGESISMLDMAKDALRVLDQAQWQDGVHLVGVSMGGMIAQEIALHSPERLASLTLIATHAGGKTAVVPPSKGIMHALSASFGPAHKRTEALAKLLYPKSYLQRCNRDELKARMKLQTGRPAARHTMRRQLSAIRAHDTRKRLSDLRLPTLIVKPEQDILVRPSHSDELHRRIPGSSLMRLPEAGHGLIFQSAKKLNERLLEHFRGALG
ncbi:MAG: alpha/beta hydrolase [Myxococcales bacterium]|nr:alpha/beta hydrolase [Myxococcales bacterium]